MRRAVRGLVNAVRRKGGQLALRSGPTRLLPEIGGQDEERLPTQTRQSLVLTKDGSQRRELDAIGS